MFEAKSPGMTWPLRLPRLIHLVDTPSEYGTPGQVLQLDATGRRLEWTTLDFVTEGELATHENTPNAHHDPFVALEDNAGTEVAPATADARIQFKTGNSILGIAAGTNIITFTVAQGNIDHGSIAGLGDNDHPHYARKASAEYISGAWVFTGTPTFSPNETNVLSITDGRVSLVNAGLNVGATGNLGDGYLQVSKILKVGSPPSFTETAGRLGVGLDLLVNGTFYKYLGGAWRSGSLIVMLASPAWDTTNWNNTDKATGSYTIDTSASPYSLPAGIKAAYIRLHASFSSTGSEVWVAARTPGSSYHSFMVRSEYYTSDSSGWVACDANGDFIVQVEDPNNRITAVMMQIFGYAL